MKVKTECPYCGATNTERNVLAWGGEEDLNKHYIFKCWQCLKGFSLFNGEVKRLPDFCDPV
jgi:transposase-like protein